MHLDEKLPFKPLISPKGAIPRGSGERIYSNPKVQQGSGNQLRWRQEAWSTVDVLKIQRAVQGHWHLKGGAGQRSHPVTTLLRAVQATGQ